MKPTACDLQGQVAVYISDVLLAIARLQMHPSLPICLPVEECLACVQLGDIITNKFTTNTGRAILGPAVVACLAL